VLLTNAGIASISLIAEMSDETWHEMFDINLGDMFSRYGLLIPDGEAVTARLDAYLEPPEAKLELVDDPQTTATNGRRAKTRLQTGRGIRLWRTLWRTPLNTRNPP
jgi:NAD(P)-dependent dehydrogenase (short-subunit alcohol dehydrogenase family)